MANIKSISESSNNEKLIDELKKGEKSGQKNGYYSIEDLESSLGITNEFSSNEVQNS